MKSGVNPKTGKARRVNKSSATGVRAEKLEIEGKSPAIAVRIAHAREIILGELRKSRSKSGACEQAEISTTQFYKWYREDAEFAAEVDAATIAGNEALVDEAVRRGKNGVRKAIYHQGEIVGYQRMYSDRLLETMLEATDPARFRKNHTVEVQGQIAHTVTTLSKEELEAALKARGLPTTIFEK